MKSRKVNLDVDFIGSQEVLTQSEEKAINDYFKKRKLASQKRPVKASTKTAMRSKSIN
jgi:hypothetical protein